MQYTCFVQKGAFPQSGRCSIWLFGFGHLGRPTGSDRDVLRCCPSWTWRCALTSPHWCSLRCFGWSNFGRFRVNGAPSESTLYFYTATSNSSDFLVHVWYGNPAIGELWFIMLYPGNCMRKMGSTQGTSLDFNFQIVVSNSSPIHQLGSHRYTL